MRTYICISLTLLMALVTACATTQTHPARVSAWDLTVGKGRLDAYVESRRQELARLQEQALNLEKRLQIKENELAVLDEQLGKETALARKAGNKQNAAEQQVLAQKTELNNIKQEIAVLKQKISEQETLLGNVKEENKRRIRETIMAYEVEIEDLDAEISVLERAIDRIVLLRTKHALETE